MIFACVGDNCIDYYDKTDESFCGGNPVNVAVYIKRLGGDSAYIGAVGTDKYGVIMKETLQSKGVDVSRLHIDNGSTALTHVEMIDGDRVLGDYDEGVMESFRVSESDIEWLSSQKIIITGLWSHTEKDLYKLRSHGAKIAFDSADRPYDSITKEAIANVDILFFSDDNSNDNELKNIICDLHSKGPELVIATRGSKGSIAFDGNTFYEYGIINCDVVDTMGAGDSYIAGFLYSYINDKGIPESMKAGAMSSAVTIGYNGAW